MSLHLIRLLIFILVAFSVIAVIAFLIRHLKNRVGVVMYKNDNPLYDIAYVMQPYGNMAEAYQPGTNSRVSIGRVSMIDDNEKALVQILISDPDDDSLEPIYTRCGYLDQNGFIYEQKSNNAPAIKVGYVARPSKPDVPCLKGERSWRSLWLHSYLDVYRFTTPIDPNPRTPYEPKVTLPGTALILPEEPIDISRHDQTFMTREEIIRDIKRNMVLVKGSTFRMGSEPIDSGELCEDGVTRGMAENNESPVHEVTLTDYYIGRFLVSQAEWKAIMGENPSECQDSLNYPVAPVSWNDCQRFIKRLNELSHENYSLPTEAQWEFAARGGKNSNGTTFSGSDKFTEVGWGDYKHEVALKKPNELGIFDMSGLVREWCSDRWGHYPADAQFNPVGPDDDDPLLIKNLDAEGELYYVVRSPSGNETVTNRKGEAASLGKDFKSYGLRLAISIPLPEPEPEPEPELEAEQDVVMTLEPETELESDQEPNLDPVMEENPEPAVEQESEEEQVVESETATEEEPESEPEEEPELKKINEPEPAPESELKPEPEPKPEPAPESERSDEDDPVKTEETAPIVLDGWRDRKKDKDEKEVKDEKNDNPAPAVKAEANRLSLIAERVARCDKQGLSNVIVGGITTESRAGAYALFAILNRRKRTDDEAYAERKHNWRDTALLSALIYTVAYVALYIVISCVLQRPIVGRLLPNPLMPIVGMVIMYLFYFVIWAIVWTYKVEKTESGKTFQPILDLLNKSVGQGKIELFIIVFGILAIPLSLTFFECDFIPLLLVILTGIIINRSVPGVYQPWYVKKSYQDIDTETLGDDNVEPDTNEPPAGNLVCTYDWVLDSEYKELKGHISIHFDPEKVREQRLNNPFYTQHALSSKDVVKSMYAMLISRKDYMERTRYLAKYINKTAVFENLTPEQTVQFALDFIQEPNIKFVKDNESESIQYSLSYMRLPDETLMDKEGDHDCKTFMAAMLYHALGYNVLFLYSPKYNHYALGVEVKNNWTNKWGEEEGKHVITEGEIKYVICETTTDRFKVGDILPGLIKEDFTTILLPCDTSENNTPDDLTRAYDWDLDSEDGASNRHGMIVLSFSKEKINELRDINPFRKPTTSTEAYIGKIRDMVSYLKTDPKRTKNLQSVVEAIKERTNDLSELNKLQFTLDFVQEPNIRYCVDRESAPLSNIRYEGEYADMELEYMRYPDETLFDKEGDCDCKSFLAAMLFNILGYDVLFLMSAEYKHAAIAIEYKPEWAEQIKDFKQELVVLQHGDKPYIYCETTGDGYRIGHIKEGEDIHHFEYIVEITK